MFYVNEYESILSLEMKAMISSLLELGHCDEVLKVNLFSQKDNHRTVLQAWDSF
jgi:hypothetical protein